MQDSRLNLIIFASGIFISYFIFGLIQEKITKRQYGPENEHFSFYFSMLLIITFINGTVALFAKNLSKEKTHKIPISRYALVSFCYIAAMLSSNYSLKYVNFPTQVIGKSIKPIPVLIFSVIWAGKRYPIRKYFFVLLISLGLILFIYKKKSSSQGSDGFHFGVGELLLMFSLFFDGMVGGIQQDLLDRYKICSFEMMFNLNLWSVLYLLPCILFSHEASSLMKFFEHHPEVIVHVACLGLASAIGQIFIFTTITNYGPLMSSIVTTTRKFFTVLVSIVVYEHMLSSQQWLGMVMVFTGLICDQIWGKTHGPAKHKKSKNH